ncbi:high affinity copper uptake protein 1 [Plakobranchus ocellatus]|uniref:Copper transport protein n=1 Tax=Plakobranchus ocellatus TaxID=259542 RepID=A0AAV4BKF8_9GAST|nr:high affinity copper uptake protein 1 [Plakobranchus ocellatus]
MYIRSDSSVYLWIYSWKVDSCTELVGACAAVFILSIIQSALRSFSLHVNVKLSNSSKKHQALPTVYRHNEQDWNDTNIDFNSVSDIATTTSSLSLSAAGADHPGHSAADGDNIETDRTSQRTPSLHCAIPFKTLSSGRHLVLTCLHMLQVIFSYCLMLVFMTFNLWLCLALVLGMGVGYFTFGRTPAKQKQEQPDNRSSVT